MEHEHSHEHAHEHAHVHTHAEHEIGNGERTRVLLQYLIDHNEQHATELADLLDGLSGRPHTLLLEAIGTFEVANTQLREVLAALEK